MEEEEFLLPAAEALLAGTLALMTAHAQACCLQRQQPMREKIVDNLAQLTLCADLSPEFRAALWRLRRPWLAMSAGRSTAMQLPAHDHPGTLQ